MYNGPRLAKGKKYYNRLNQLRVEKGYTQTQLAEKVGILRNTVYQLGNSTLSPVNPDGLTKEYVNKIADLLGEEPEEIFPDEITQCRIPDYTKVTNGIILDATSSKFSLDSTSAEHPDHFFMAIIRQCIKRLTEREQMVLQKRFFEDLTLHEIGQILNLTQARIRSIEAEALQKIRKQVVKHHPEAANEMRAWVTTSNKSQFSWFIHENEYRDFFRLPLIQFNVTSVFRYVWRYEKEDILKIVKDFETNDPNSIIKRLNILEHIEKYFTVDESEYNAWRFEQQFKIIK